MRWNDIKDKGFQKKLIQYSWNLVSESPNFRIEIIFCILNLIKFKEHI